MASTPKTTTTTSTTEPWSGAKGYLLDQYSTLDNLYKSGAPQAYQGSLIADQSQATKDALAQAENIARNGNTSTLTNATNAVNSVMNSNGNQQAQNTYSQLQNTAGFSPNPTNDMASKIANGQFATGQASNNPAMQYLQQTASGANIGNNPYLSQMVSNQQDQIANKLKNITNPGIDSQAAAIGRMGSGAYATQRNNAETAAANEMAKVATDMYGNQYNQDVSNQMNAANAYGSLYNQDIANNQNQQANDRSYQLSGMNTLSNNYQNNISNMLGLNDQKLNAANASVAADSSLASQKLNAANMAGQTYQNQYLPSQQLANVGASQDSRLDALKAAEIGSWDQQQQQPIMNAANFINLLNGGGYNSTTSQTPVYSNTGGQILGGLSSLAGLFALCQASEKVLHKHVGFMPLTNGDRLAIYEFTYKNDPDQQLWYGPIAEEVDRKTDAAIEIDGKLHVDVNKLMEAA
ncbi:MULTISPECIES: hypothetical protein [Agrobacterium]|uniref:hypothetical protein n=1 Tax=Agrobacterium TaxID=357 RepID=UPI00230145E6|nr:MULTISPECIES: hypothetical protein [Agrobacterium]MDA5636546.1 hypothetical protein [Agrobacterium sp. ST15.13.013]MDA6998684.1 hypothetical protein [Agrobacterium salinitolerans]